VVIFIVSSRLSDQTITRDGGEPMAQITLCGFAGLVASADVRDLRVRHARH
jgi:hypothetical protein